MNSRTKILEAVARHRPPPRPHPGLPSFPAPGDDLAARFREAATGVNATCLTGSRDTLGDVVRARYPGARVIAALEPDLLPGTQVIDATTAPAELATIDLLVCRGTLGVAESGAVWVRAEPGGHRAALFLAEHLLLLLPADRLVWNLHQAYDCLDVAAEDFGVFVAGPSKTADIAQALVIGAHGPRSVTVYLIEPGPPDAATAR